jgi:hypothetical protein
MPGRLTGLATTSAIDCIFVQMSRAALAPRLEILVGDHDREQIPLSLVAEGVVRSVWESAFGPILIEVRDGVAVVNGAAVTPIADTERDAR